jgi:hypothetical protein
MRSESREVRRSHVRAIAIAAGSVVLMGLAAPAVAQTWTGGAFTSDGTTVSAYDRKIAPDGR